MPPGVQGAVNRQRVPPSQQRLSLTQKGGHDFCGFFTEIVGLEGWKSLISEHFVRVQQY